MYLRNTLKPAEPARSWPGLAALGVCAAVTLAGGVLPFTIQWATRAVVP